MARKQRAFHSIVESLRNDILKGERQPGERLPGEQVLVEEFDVSRSVVREAVRVLEAQGLVEVHHGYQGGAFVATDALTPLLAALQFSLQLGQLDIDTLYEARLVVEPALARLAAQRGDPESIEMLRAKHTEIQGLAEAGGDAFVANLEFHALLAQAAGNRALSLLVEALFGLLETSHGRHPPSQTVINQAVADHERLVEAIASGKPQKAERAMRDHLVGLGERFRELEQASEDFGS